MHGLRLIWYRSPQLFPALASFRYRTALWTAPFTSLNRSCCVYLCTFAFTSLTPAFRGPSVKSLFRCARYTVCSFVFLFRLFPAFVSVLRVCLPPAASRPRPLFQTDHPGPHLAIGAQAPSSSGPDSSPEFFCRESQLPTVSAGLCTFFLIPSIRRIFISCRLSLQNLLADSASYRRLLTWNPVLCFC